VQVKIVLACTLQSTLVPHRNTAFRIVHMSTSFARFYKPHLSFPPHFPTVLHVQGVQSTRGLNLRFTLLFFHSCYLCSLPVPLSHSHITIYSHEIAASSHWSSTDITTSWILYDHLHQSIRHRHRQCLGPTISRDVSRSLPNLPSTVVSTASIHCLTTPKRNTNQTQT